MKFETRQKLLEEYKGLTNPKETTAIKYWYQYKKVNVNIYFDAFDSENLNLALVLALEKSYYYTSLNINNSSISKEFLAKIPKEILELILDNNNMLDSFFQSIENHISLNESWSINYEKDNIFSNTLKYSKSRTDLPFLSGIRKVPMSSKMFMILKETMGIEINILKEIQHNKITLVRTADPTRRKKLTLVLNSVL